MPEIVHGLARRVMWTMGLPARAIDRAPSFALLAFSVVHFYCAVRMAIWKPLWTDEFFTFYLSNLTPLRELWAALTTGADQHPPLFYLATRVFCDLLGLNPVAVRMPAILGYWLMSLCLYALVVRRTTPACGLIAVSIAMVTEAYSYAVEARGYAPAVGLVALALLGWQLAAEGHRRPLALFGLAVGSAGAVSSHYYAVFALATIAAGEFVREIRLRHIDLPIWAAFATATVPLIAGWSFVGGALNWAGTFWAVAEWSDVRDFYWYLLEPAALLGVLVIGLLCVDAITRGSWQGLPPNRRLVPLHELVAVGGLAASPLFIVGTAMMTTGAFTSRYALPAVIGCSALSAFGVYAMTSRRDVVLSVLLLILVVGFAIHYRHQVEMQYYLSTERFVRQAALLRGSEESSLPIVAWRHDDYLMLRHYGPADIASRVVYLASPAASLKRLGHDTVDRGALALRQWFGPGVYELEAFLRSSNRFLAYGVTGDLSWGHEDWNWLVPELLERGARMELVRRAGDEMVFLVEVGMQQTASQSSEGP